MVNQQTLIIDNFVITGIMCLKKKQINCSMLKVYVIMCTLVFVSMIVNMDIHGYTMWLLLAVALFAEETINYDTVYQQYENLMLWICVFSLIGTVLWLVKTELVYARPRVNGVVTDIRNFYVTTVLTVYQGLSFRNFGIFRGPAMFCIYIGLALLRQFYYLENISIKRSVIFLVTIVTTRSVTGFIAVIFLYIMFIFLKKKRGKEFGFCTITLTGAVIASKVLGVLSYFLERLGPGGGSSYSINSRIYSIVCGLMAGLTNPVFGRGTSKSEEVFGECVRVLNITEGACWANMVTYLFASFGILFVVFYSGLYGMGLTYCDSKIVLWITAVFIILLLCGGTMTYSTLLYTFMMYGLKNLKEHRLFAT